MARVNPRQMKQAMKKMGISQTEVPNVTEVIIRTKENEIVLTDAQVVRIEMSGSRSYQIVGNESVRPLSAEAEAGSTIPEEDIELVMSQTGCDREKAIEALEASGGQPAEAIVLIVAG
ncbi:MAG: nascent polypeptide-associated complex protein [Candidatus Methanomethylophilaceae archaeon]|jgi:nascent polypeptide-associated complex subunit alpha